MEIEENKSSTNLKSNLMKKNVTVVIIRHKKQTRLKKFQKNLEKQLARRSRRRRRRDESVTDRIVQTLEAVKKKRGRLKRKQIS